MPVPAALPAIVIKRGDCGAAGPASAPPLGLEGPRGARRAIRRQNRQTQALHTSRISL